MWHLMWWNEYSLTLLCNWYLWASVSEWCKLLVFVSICLLSIVSTALSRFESRPPHPYVENLTHQNASEESVFYLFIYVLCLCVCSIKTCEYTHACKCMWKPRVDVCHSSLSLSTFYFEMGFRKEHGSYYFRQQILETTWSPYLPPMIVGAMPYFSLAWVLGDLNSCHQAQTANTSLTQLGGAYSSVTHTLLENART